MTVLLRAERHSMMHSINVNYHPVFERGIFAQYPALFDRFLRHTPENLKREYQKVRETLPEYEASVMWPLIDGPGFCGATHPGAENVFNTIMVNSNSPIYNSDCLYINPSRSVFAISDAPGMTTCSRKLFERLDHYLRIRSVDDLEAIIDDLNNETQVDDRATLSLIGFPGNEPAEKFKKAVLLVAGDTYLFQGNLLRGTIRRIEDDPNFIGRSYVHFKPKHIELEDGDFFVVASDGITDIRFDHQDAKLEEALWSLVNNNPERFAFHATRSCNRIIPNGDFNRVTTRFGGSDNVSALLVYPERLTNHTCSESFILGGYIMRKTT